MSQTSAESRPEYWVDRLPGRIVGAALLVCALDPPKWPLAVNWIWFVGLAAALLGFYAGAPKIDRPVFESHKLRHRVSRQRNTMLAIVAVGLAAALPEPPTWFMAVDVVILVAFLGIIDLSSATPRRLSMQAGHAAGVLVGAGIVLAAATVTITGGGWWGRLVAGGAVVGTGLLLYVSMRLERPAFFPPRKAPARTRRERARSSERYR